MFGWVLFLLLFILISIYVIIHFAFHTRTKRAPTVTSPSPPFNSMIFEKAPITAGKQDS